MPFFMNPFKKHDAKDFDVLVDLASAERHPFGGKMDTDAEPERASDVTSGYTVETLRAEIDLGMRQGRLTSKKNS